MSVLQSIGISKDRQQKNALGILTVLTLAFQGLNLFLILFLVGAYFGLANKAPQSLVQLEQGRTVSVEPLDSGYRTPAVVQSFVRDTMQLLFSASGSVPGQEGMVPDAGVEVTVDGGGTAKISSLAHLALFLLSADFHPAIISVLAERTPQEVFNRSGNTQLILDIRDVSEPIPIPGTKNRWEVSLVANKVILQGGSIVSLTPFNRTVLVRSIDVPRIAF